MKICVAQTRPVKGNIAANINRHKEVIDLAAGVNAGIIIFPELSLTGYEPQLAKELATDEQDSRLDIFQKISDNKEITIGVGIPTKNNTGVSISMIIFQPHEERRTYSKKYLHSDEEPFFISGANFSCLHSNNIKIGLSICYELSVPQHAEDAFESGAKIYLASVAKTAAGVERANKRLAEIASQYSMTVLVSNCIGDCDGEVCGGKTSAWNSAGVLTGQLNDTEEGILVIDTDTQEVIQKPFTSADI